MVHSKSNKALNNNSEDFLSSYLLVAAVAFSASTLYFTWLRRRDLRERQNAMKDATQSIDEAIKKLAELEPQIDRRLQKILEKIGRSSVAACIPKLTREESIIAAEIADPGDALSTFAAIGGLGELKQELYALAILPLKKPGLFRSVSGLVKQPSGILLHGKPGTGKTMLAKAIARECKAIFIPIQPSVVLGRYLGEATKMVSATFTVAEKLGPSVIFFDEMDCIFPSGKSDGSACGHEHQSMKAELLTRWDGIKTQQNAKETPVLVIGATNHPKELDAAILRRFSRHFEVPMPDAKARCDILRVFLKDHALDESAKSFLPHLADLTEGYSGSDLYTLCCTTAMEPVLEIAAKEARKIVIGVEKEAYGDDDRSTGDVTWSESVDVKNEHESVDEVFSPRPLTEEDFRTAFIKCRPTGQAAAAYHLTAPSMHSMLMSSE